jgi:DNA replication protein DnaC
VITGRLRKSQLLDAGILEDYWTLTLDAYHGPKRPCRLVRQYIAKLTEMRKEGLSFLFYGQNNAGKTTLAMILAKAFLLNKLTAYCTNLRDMTDLFVQGWKSDDERRAFTDRVRDRDLLVIDDLLKELHNKATATVLDSVLRHRSNRHMPFVITTNASMDELEEQYGPSFVALLQRRCIAIQFDDNTKQSAKLVDRNLDLLQRLES